jgi:hypothetical protein
MKKQIIAAISLALAPSLFAEGPADDVKAAAKKLSESGYTWTITNPGRDGGPGTSTEGKAGKDGVVSLKNTFGDRTTETIIKGGKAAVKTDEGWKSGEELAAASEGGEGGGRGRGFGGFAARMAQDYKAPAAELETLIAGTRELKKDGDAISGDLTEEAAKERLAFGGRGGRRPGGGGGDNANRPAPKDAKGSVKFWIKDGALAKYELTVSGTIEGRDGQSRDINRTSTVEFKDVGTTKVDVPAEAASKLPSGDAKKTEEKKEEKTEAKKEA